MNDLLKILDQEEEITEDQLIRYLSGEASVEERFKIENKMADSPFVNDAIEGLKDFNDPVQLTKFTEELNRQLKKQTDKRVQKKLRRKIIDQYWITIAILGILFLCIIGYLLIHFLKITKS
jgi:hypothetical protein